MLIYIVRSYYTIYFELLEGLVHVLFQFPFPSIWPNIWNISGPQWYLCVNGSEYICTYCEVNLSKYNITMEIFFSIYIAVQIVFYQDIERINLFNQQWKAKQSKLNLDKSKNPMSTTFVKRILLYFTFFY